MKLPIIFSPWYDIRLLGIEKLHPIDSEKYGKVHRYLVDTCGIDEGIIERDGIVFRSAMERKIPILMLLSGGHTRKSAGGIGRSIENILKNIIGVTP